VSVVSCRFPNSITTTCCGLVGRVANKSVTSWQLPRLRGSYGETCVIIIIISLSRVKQHNQNTVKDRANAKEDNMR